MAEMNETDRQAAQTLAELAKADIPHRYVGIGAGELGMSPCDACGDLERSPIHSLKFLEIEHQRLKDAVVEAAKAMRSAELNICDLGFPSSEDKDSFELACDTFNDCTDALLQFEQEQQS